LEESNKSTTDLLLEQVVAELRLIRAALEQRARPRDADDRRVLLALTGAVGDSRFNAAEVNRSRRLPSCAFSTRFSSRRKAITSRGWASSQPSRHANNICSGITRQI
jgi:hypothetical protein